MNFLQTLAGSISDFISSLYSSHSSPIPTAEDWSMDANHGRAVPPAAVVSERVAMKLKGYFELAKEEIDKALRAEEWGLPEDALALYRNALHILLEAKGTRVPDAVSSSERSEVRVYQQKIAKWQTHVEDRMQILGQRLENEARKTVPSNTTVRKDGSTSGSRKFYVDTMAKRVELPAKNPRNGNGGFKPSQKNDNGYVDQLVEMINSTIVDRSPAVKWDDVAGLGKAKQALLEMVILPTKRRDLFTGLRRPAKGLLLFGPPGNGKTMLAKAVASESEATFFNVSASSLTSKWVGEGEKLVRTLFMVAVSRQPSVIFIDEIDSIMSARLANENDSSRRLKSEFLIQFDGVTSNPNDLVIVIGATNKPQELDEAVLRRLVKRIYIPLPDSTVRKLLLKNYLKGQSYALSGGELDNLISATEGYSASDLKALCEEAAMVPIRELGPEHILTIKANQVRALNYNDLKKAISIVRPSLQKGKWQELENWNQEFGSN